MDHKKKHNNKNNIKNTKEKQNNNTKNKSDNKKTKKEDLQKIKAEFDIARQEEITSKDARKTLNAKFKELNQHVNDLEALIEKQKKFYKKLQKE